MHNHNVPKLKWKGDSWYNTNTQIENKLESFWSFEQTPDIGRHLNFGWTQRHWWWLGSVWHGLSAVVVAAIDVVVAIITIEWIQWQFTKTGCSKGHFNTFFCSPSICVYGSTLSVLFCSTQNLMTLWLFKTNITHSLAHSLQSFDTGNSTALFLIGLSMKNDDSEYNTKHIVQISTWHVIFF